VATIFKQLQEPPPLDGPIAAGLPATVKPVLATAMAKDREERYSSAAEVAQALRAAWAESYPDQGPASGFVSVPGGDGDEEASTRLTGTPTPTRGTAGTPRTGPQAPPQATTATSSPSRGTGPTPRPTAAVGRPATAPVPRPRQPAPAVARRSGLPLVAVLGGAAAVVIALGIAGWVVLKPAPPTPAPEPATTLPAPTPTLPPTTVVPSPVASPPETPVPTAAPTVAPTAAPSAAPSTRPATPAPTPTAAPTTAPTPAPTPRPPVATGVLRLTVKPWADVTVDGRSMGQSGVGVPLALTLSVGAHTIRLVHPEYPPVVRRVDVRAGEPVRLRVDFTEPGAK
jgi:hypothetical protein